MEHTNMEIEFILLFKLTHKIYVKYIVHLLLFLVDYIVQLIG